MNSKTTTRFIVLTGITLVLTWMFGQIFTQIFAATRQPNSPLIGDYVSLSTAVGFAFGLIISLFLAKYGKTSTFLNQVIEEVSKVAWPSSEETRMGTIITIMFTVIVSGILFVFDYFFNFLTSNNYFLY